MLTIRSTEKLNLSGTTDEANGDFEVVGRYEGIKGES
jgi:hypothetical protein